MPFNSNNFDFPHNLSVQESIKTTYEQWFLIADEAWCEILNLEEEQAAYDGQETSEAIRLAEIEIEMIQWKEAAEYAEKQMHQMDKCMYKRIPNPLFIPGTAEEIVRNEVFA